MLKRGVGIEEFVGWGLGTKMIVIDMFGVARRDMLLCVGEGGRLLLMGVSNLLLARGGGIGAVIKLY